MRSLLIMQHVIEAVQGLLQKFPEPLLALETGTIRSYHEGHESTRHIGETLKGEGRLISVDISPAAIRISRDICRHLDNIDWILSDSRDYLPSLLPDSLHFVLLDSCNNQQVIWDEFVAVAPKVKSGGVLMVDDAGILIDGSGLDTSEPAQKGHRVWQFLKAREIPFDILEAPAGHGTQIKVLICDKLKQSLQEHLLNASS